MMSTSRGSSGGNGVQQAIPAGSRKMVQSLKEIVNCTDAEIYAALRDCNMDPNEAINRLLSQDPFHEVKSKMEKKKEIIGTSTRNDALENFKSLLMKCANASSPTHSLTSPHETFIEQRIEEFFPSFSTPNHPPYAWMIQNAIKQLNGEEGSSEEAISKFILAEHKDLPWAHATLLKQHLRKLCDCGSLVESPDGCYLIGDVFNSSKPSSHPGSSPNPSPSASPSDGKKSQRRKRKPSKNVRGRGRGRKRRRGPGWDSD